MDLSPLAFLAAIAALAVLGIFLYVNRRYEGRERKGIVGGITATVGIIAAIVLALLVVSWVRAETEWFGRADLWAGLERDMSLPSPQCTDGDGLQATGDFGARLQVFRWGRFSTSTYYHHQSCAFDRDRSGFSNDAVGLQFGLCLWGCRR